MTVRHRATLGMAVVVAAVVSLASATEAAPVAPGQSQPVSGATATVTVRDGFTPSGIEVKPFKVKLTVKGISFPSREGGNEAQPGNVFVHLTARVKNLAMKSRPHPVQPEQLPHDGDRDESHGSR